MIKKYLFGIGITILGFIGFSNAGYTQLIGLEGISSPYDTNYTLSFLKGGGVLSNFLGQGKSVLALKSDVLVWWSPNGYLYAYLKPSNSYLGLQQGFFDRFYSCDYIPDYTGSMPGNCTIGGYIAFTGSYVETNKQILKTFFNQVKQGDIVYYNYDDTRYIGATSDGSSNVVTVCWSSESVGKSLCFKGGRCAGVHSSNCDNGGSLIDSQDIRDNMTFAGLPISYIGYAPGNALYGDTYDPGDDTTFGSGNTDTIPTNIDSYVSYYENNFGFNENMCYVGTDDLDSLYGASGIEFDYGSGATIYGLYHHIYSGFGSNKIHNVGSFVNVWLLNYASWFKTLDSERLYMAQYNGPDQNVTYIYSGFTFPFENKPVAIYFMADLLSEEYITESSQGENIVFYCDMKLNYDNYKNGSLNFKDTEDLVDDKIKERAKEYNNRTNPGQDGYSVPDLGSGSIWDGLVQSGFNIPADLNPTKLFKDFYDKINNLFRNFNPAVSVGIIPLWILYPMLFLILFRIMRH